jgi:hypothetical protein
MALPILMALAIIMVLPILMAVPVLMALPVLMTLPVLILITFPVGALNYSYIHYTAYTSWNSHDCRTDCVPSYHNHSSTQTSRTSTLAGHY